MCSLVFKQPGHLCGVSTIVHYESFSSLGRSEVETCFPSVFPHTLLTLGSLKYYRSTCMTCWHFDSPKSENAVCRRQSPYSILGPEARVPNIGFAATVPKWGVRVSEGGLFIPALTAVRALRNCCFHSFVSSQCQPFK